MQSFPWTDKSPLSIWLFYPKGIYLNLVWIRRQTFNLYRDLEDDQVIEILQ